ncbi:MAG: flavin reductase family protein [Pseudomonadales bacterium]|nr:flavin reductase family protein [Pseudomonadales bacterium]
MHIDPLQNSKADNYKLLTNLVVPRPIAWVSSLSPQGVLNLAPFSFFNAIGADPLYVLFSVGRYDTGTLKDTARNVEHHKAFVVNMVTEDLFDAMNLSAADFPPEISEFEAAGLTAEASLRIPVPRVAAAQAALECRLHSTQMLGENQLIIGEVVMFHVADHLLGPKMHINNFAPLGRMGSPSVYCRTADRFDLPRISYASWSEHHMPVK